MLSVMRTMSRPRSRLPRSLENNDGLAFPGVAHLTTVRLSEQGFGEFCRSRSSGWFVCDSPVRIVEHINRARSVPRRDLVEIKTKGHKNDERQDAYERYYRRSLRPQCC
ncbi:hypothetical protein PAZ_c23100 [Cutibacterium acnes 266]|nr:hypothetical protein PAZ_c23100 [Cutibacterium acnes 266]